MAKVKITGHASGSGVITVTAPNTSTDRTITLPDSTGTILDENSSLPAANLTGTVATARLGSGTASSGTILYGDQTYKTAPTSFNPDAAVTINESGADVDFRVESDTNTHALYVNGEGDSVALGHTGKLSSVYTTDGGTAITGNTLTVYKSGANTPGILELAGNSNVENQYVGAISFLNNENSNSGGYERKNIATITAQLRTANSNSGNNSGGDLVFWTKANVGSNYERLRLTHDGRGLSQFTAKTWVNFNGTGTVAIRDSHNVSSVTDNATGDYSINYSNNLANVNYSVQVSSSGGGGNAYSGSWGDTDMTCPAVFNMTVGRYQQISYELGVGYFDTNLIMGVVFGD